MLLAGVVLKLVPVMVTVVPAGPAAGVKLLTVGEGAETQTTPDGVSPVIVQLFVEVKFVLAATALVPYCLPSAPNVLPLGVDGLALQPISVAE